MRDRAPIAPDLLAAWLTARSIARNLPAPVPDRGGLRVDTNSAKEAKRWVFPGMTGAVADLAREIDGPRHLIKVCVSPHELDHATPSRWRIQPVSYVMTSSASKTPPARALPDGYRLRCDRRGSTTYARIETQSGALAASGYAAEAAGVFVYDRIETEAAHRRLGLGCVVMETLGAARKSQKATQVLVATENGHGLYASLGWMVIAPYSTVMIPDEAPVAAAESSTGPPLSV